MELNLNDYMNRHIYMFSGKQSTIKFKAVKEMVGDIVDVFGTGFSIIVSEGGYLVLSAKVSEQTMLQYAKEFAPDVIVLEPRELAERIRDELTQTIAQYRTTL